MNLFFVCLFWLFVSWLFFSLLALFSLFSLFFGSSLSFLALFSLFWLLSLLSLLSFSSLLPPAHELLETFVNAHGNGHVAMGSSATMVLATLANAYAKELTDEDEVIISFAGHEANVGNWEKCCQSSGAIMKVWKPTEEATCPMDELKELMTPNTKIVAFPHVSNLLGEIVDVRAIADYCRSVNPEVRIVCDGVAYAPHRAIDVEALGVDYYCFSLYKVFATHVGALYMRTTSAKEITGPNHFYVADDDIVHKFELGGVSQEACAGVLGLQPYFQAVAGQQDKEVRSIISRDTVEKAYDTFATLENSIQETIMEALVQHPNIKIWGPSTSDPAVRVPTISFTHATLTPKELVRRFHQEKIAIRSGNVHSPRLADTLNMCKQGVARVSLVHYNTPEEVEKFVDTLNSLDL
eukprot:m.143469 g.143469  ORF g.143469 m.143469 type:complete len:409 (-) comp24218_c0_seq3:77-1303(-)